MSRGDDVRTPSRSPALPSGTVTFLFTDIEGSTKRWDRHGDAMRAAVARHEQIIVEAIDRHDGSVFKTVGDAFCAAFPTATSALRAAVDVQAALAREDFSGVDGLRVRIGVHTGRAEERNGDYFGPTVNRVARLMSIGHGGQTLVSDLTRALAQGELPTNVALTDLGVHRLKDLAEPEHVWQLGAAGQSSAFPPLVSLDSGRNNLPAQPASFHGRDRDVEDLKKLIDEHRVVTLVGAGGIGKTRLAVQISSEMLDAFPDGVWFADLSPIADPELVSSVVANALGISQVEGQRVDDLIPKWLRRKKLLLIVDNCEHVLSPIAGLIDAIHRSAPDVCVLATSRQALGIVSEAAYRLSTLAVPEVGASANAREAMRYASIAVFADRARRFDTRFALTDENVPFVAEICRRLDGMPLAIELAAARVKVLSISSIAKRLDERFTLLTGGTRTALPRQQTLTALIDWSYDLLTAREQRLFASAGVFAGSFGLDAVTKVCQDEEIDDVALLDLLASLTDKSLVVAEISADRERYRLLESTRSYARAKLAAAGERGRLSRRHAEYFRDIARAADERRSRAPSVSYVAGLAPDLDNFRAALEWTINEENDAVIGGDIAGSISQLWIDGGLGAEGRYWIARALARVDETKHPRVAARLWRGSAVLSRGQVGVAAAERAASLYDSVGDRRGATISRSTLVENLTHLGRIDEAGVLCERVIETMRELGEPFGIATALNRKANIASIRGDLGTARDSLSEAEALLVAFGPDAALAHRRVLNSLAEIEFKAGHAEAAERLLESATGDDAQNDVNISAYRIALGDLDGALASAQRALALMRKEQDPIGTAVAIQHLALLAVMRERTGEAGRLLGYVDSQFSRLAVQRDWPEQWGYEKLIATLREKITDDEITQLGAEGASWSEDQAVRLALGGNPGDEHR
jgi:predicted ATPase/class 3 adenylate cyclase